MPRALEESGAKIGEVITAQRTGTKLVTVKELQEQPDGSKQEVKIQTRRNSWAISSHGVDRQAVIKAYDTHVQTPAHRRQFEQKHSQLVALRDQAVSQLKPDAVKFAGSKCS